MRITVLGIGGLGLMRITVGVDYIYCRQTRPQLENQRILEIVKSNNTHRYIELIFVLLFSESDRCEKNNGGCLQICRDIENGVECDCVEGYKRSPNNKDCMGKCNASSWNFH